MARFNLGALIDLGLDANRPLLESHPDVAQACVVPVDDDVRGQMPVAFIVPAGDAMPTEETLKAHAIAAGPAYQHPRFVFTKSELPLTGTNKIDRRRLILEAQHSVARAGATRAKR